MTKRDPRLGCGRQPLEVRAEQGLPLTVRTVQYDVLELPGEDRPGREGSRVATGQTAAGRYLRVIYVADPEPDSVFVITAYELTGKPVRAYRRRRRQKGKR